MLECDCGAFFYAKSQGLPSDDCNAEHKCSMVILCAKNFFLLSIEITRRNNEIKKTCKCIHDELEVSLNKQLDRFEKMMKNFMIQCNKGKIIEERRSLKYYHPSS